jgi:tape measure domain-containing protein
MPSVDVGLTITAINNASNAIKGVGADVKNLGENAQATSNRLKAIQVVIAGILLEKTVEWTKKVVEAAAATQNLDLRMAGFAGSAKKAHAIWSDLAATFAGTPVKMDTISQSWIKLRSVVSSNDQATTIIKSVANAVLALGGSDENINNVASAFQRMFASGSASSREYKSILQQTGITLGDLAKVAHTTSTAIETELRRGFMNAQQFTEMFVKAANSRFGFFAQNLKNSIGGAYQLIFNTLSKDISDLGAKTDVNARVTVFFQNLAHAIDDVMGSINQSQIDKFWDWLRKIEPLIQNTVTSLIHIAQALLTIGSAIATLLAKMPQEATEYGIIGYMLLGKKGAALGAMLGTLQHNQIGMNAATAPNVDSGRSHRLDQAAGRQRAGVVQSSWFKLAECQRRSVHRGQQRQAGSAELHGHGFRQGLGQRAEGQVHLRHAAGLGQREEERSMISLRRWERTAPASRARASPRSSRMRSRPRRR